MALVKCKECGKQISSNANACPACDNPLSGVNSAGSNSAFENRVEQYKANGYVIRKRESNTIKLYKQAKTSATLFRSCI